MNNFFKKLLGIKEFPRSYGPANHPPRPADWHKTVDDLMKEVKDGVRQKIHDHELFWAREYAISLLPDNIRYPQKGDVYEALIDHNITFLTSWMAPYTGDGEAVIFAGEKIWIDGEPVGEKPIAVYAQPMDYKTLEERMVPIAERTSPKYSGFYFYLNSLELIEKFKLIETNFTKN